MSSLLDTFGPPVGRIPGLFGVVQQRGSEKGRAKVGMCKEKNDAIVCCWWKGAESRSSLKSGILSAWQEHKGWHLPWMRLDKEVTHTQKNPTKSWVSCTQMHTAGIYIYIFRNPKINLNFASLTDAALNEYPRSIRDSQTYCITPSFYINTDVTLWHPSASLYRLKYWVSPEPFLAARQWSQFCWSLSCHIFSSSGLAFHGLLS